MSVCTELLVCPDCLAIEDCVFIAVESTESQSPVTDTRIAELRAAGARSLRFLLFRYLRVELQFGLRFRNFSGLSVGLRQTIVRLFQPGSGRDGLLIGRNRLGEILSLRIENPELQIGGAELRIEAGRPSPTVTSLAASLPLLRGLAPLPKTNGVIVIGHAHSQVEALTNRSSLSTIASDCAFSAVCIFPMNR